jgi:TatD DNase family protein
MRGKPPYHKGRWAVARERMRIASPQPPAQDREAAALADALPTLMKRLGLDAAHWMAELEECWRETVGGPVAQHTRPGRVERGRLTVFVDSSVWLNELARYGRATLLSALRKKFGAQRIKDLTLQLDPDGPRPSRRRRESGTGAATGSDTAASARRPPDSPHPAPANAASPDSPATAPLWFDSHAHFTSTAAAADTLERARRAGVARILAVGGCDEANAIAQDLARRFPACVRAAVGYDRDQAPAFAQTDPTALAQRLRAALPASDTAVAIGEIGLDFHYQADTAEAQIHLFRAQLALARERACPVAVHSREAAADTLRELERHARAWRGAPDRMGVLHCFCGDDAMAQALLALGFCLSFSGILTFPHSDALRSVARRVPADRLLIETDAPYLTPAPLRGRRNEPAYLPHTAAVLAQVRGVTLPHLAQTTMRNACRLFGLPAPM